MKKLCCISTLVCILCAFVAAQNAVVTHNSNLRSDPSTNHNPITLLTPGTTLELVEPNATNKYFHVKTSDGTEGWVWGRNVHVTPAVARVGPPELYPDSAKTKGKADTLDIQALTRKYTDNCPSGKPTCTYSQSHRNVPGAVHTAVYDEYAVPADKRNKTNGEVDHFYPLCAGGSNDQANLWYQPAVNEWNNEDFGYHAKDKLETYVCAQIKAGKLTPSVAYQRITQDWVKFYMDEGLDDGD